VARATAGALILYGKRRQKKREKNRLLTIVGLVFSGLVNKGKNGLGCQGRLGASFIDSRRSGPSIRLQFEIVQVFLSRSYLVLPVILPGLPFDRSS